MVTNNFTAERTQLAYQTWLYQTEDEWKASPSYIPSRTRRRLWTLADEKTVQLLYPTKMPSHEIADKLGRSVGSVRAKARQLGVRRPLRGKSARGALTGTPTLTNLLVERACPFDQIRSLFQTRGSRLSWSNDSLDMLAELWKRSFTASLIATLIGTTPGAVRERANRAGLPPRHGITLINAVEFPSPLDHPICHAIADQIVVKEDSDNGMRWFVQKKDKRRLHYSKDRAKRIARFH